MEESHSKAAINRNAAIILFYDRKIKKIFLQHRRLCSMQSSQDKKRSIERPGVEILRTVHNNAQTRKWRVLSSSASWKEARLYLHNSSKSVESIPQTRSSRRK